MKIYHKVMGFGVTLLLGLSILAGCNANSQQPKATSASLDQNEIPDPVPETPQTPEEYKTIGEIPSPTGYSRLAVNETSFGHFLRSLPLKEKGSTVLLHNGSEKWNQSAHFRVIDLPIGTRDLHQCADAVMRVRADYLRNQNRPADIHFNFVSGFKCEYQKWMQGYRIKVSGNNVTWYKGAEPSNSDATYWKYLEMVWSYAGTLSLEKELKPKSAKDLMVGDVWIWGGSPGHAILVVDIAENSEGEKLFMLAQSYMPAQEMHVLNNPNDDDLSPWYRIPEGDLVTPQWTFENNQLREW